MYFKISGKSEENSLLKCHGLILNKVGRCLDYFHINCVKAFFAFL